MTAVDEGTDNKSAEARIRKLVERAKEAEARAAEADARMSDVLKRMESAEASQAERDKLISELRAAQDQQTADHQLERAIMARGITDAEGLDIARYAYDKLGDERPPIEEWLAGTLPRSVAAYLPAPAAPAVADAPSVQGIAQTQQPTPGRAVPANAGATSTPSYEGAADYKAAASNPEYYKANRSRFIGEGGVLKTGD